MGLSKICREFEKVGLYTQAEQDFSRYQTLTSWQRGVYADFCEKRRRACITLRIVRGIPYVIDLFPSYQSRHRATLQAIYRAVHGHAQLPDTEITIDLTDGELQRVDVPVFMITHHRSQPVGILYPDFTFYSWPESACPPSEPSHSYAVLREKFVLNWTHRIAPWRNRSDSIFWRGAHVEDQGGRETAVEHLRHVPQSDAKFIAWRTVSVTGQNQVHGCVGLLEQCRHRFLAFLAGTTYSSRLKYQLLCGSTVLAADPSYVEWWTHLLRPGMDFAVVASDWHNVAKVASTLRQFPSKARRIAMNGQRLALRALSPLAVDCYWRRLFALAAAVLPQPMPSHILPPHARPLEDALLWPAEAELSAQTGLTGGPPPLLVPLPPAFQNSECFPADGILTGTRCCDIGSFGPLGDPRCWDGGTLTFARCCLSASG